MGMLSALANPVLYGYFNQVSLIFFYSSFIEYFTCSVLKYYEVLEYYNGAYNTLAAL